MIKGARDFFHEREALHNGDVLRNIQVERDQLKKLEIENLKNEIMELKKRNWKRQAQPQ